jgi:ubiquitin carboxyl-terminal hydrolase 34
MDITEADPTSPPVIEILDDDDNELATNFLVQLNAEDHFRQFPRSERFRSHMEALREMVKLVQSGQSYRHNFRFIETLLTNKDLDIPHDLLPALAHWLQDLPDDPSAQLQEFYTTRVLFWNDFASLVSKVLGRRYRWMTALNAGQDDDMTRYPFGEQFGDDLAVDEVFSNFLSAYMRLCSHLFLVDVHMLSCQRPDEHYSSPLLSEKHLRHLLTILRTEKEPVFHLLRKEHAINLHEMSDRLHTDFLTVNGAQNLLRLADEAFHKVPPIVQTHIATYTSQVLGTLGWTICRFPHASSGIDPAEYYRGTLLFFRKYTEDLQEPAKVTDANVARDMIMFFSDLIQEICQWDEQLAKDLADELLDFDDPESPTSSSVDTDTIANQNDYRQYPDILPVLIANAWKFRLLRKYIVKGRMELRVMSIFLMDKALVELHREYSAIEPLNKHPVLRYLADVLLRGRVVDYIISVDSHPQLISRSGNIVGFLVVTDRWLDRQADAVWNTVSNSPDPRVVAATMTMLRNIIGLMGPSDHLYLCLKIHSLSVESFTLDILRFLRELTTKLLNRHPPVDWSLRNDTARPWNVCVRLLQDTAPRNGVSKHELDLHAEADDQLRSLANEIPERDQHNIYRQCLEHIAQGSDAATGSVRIVYILSSFGDVTFLEQNVDMARQILEELSSFVKTESKRGLHRYQLSALQYRLELLAFLVSRVGHIVPEDLYRELWDHVVGMYALSDRARDVAWAQLSEAIRSSPDNDFCRKLVSNYVSVMDPQHYTSGLYDFVASYNFPITRKFVLVDDEEHTLLQIPGSNLLWSLALLSPQGTIEERASRLLATRYSQIIQNGEVTVSEVEAAHVELVEQCMKELRSAFNVLREGPEQSKQSSRDRFGRVLMFQRQMLESVRQKPEFNRGRRADSKVESMDTEVPAADAVTIKYQCANDRQSLLIAPDNTVEDLYRRLCHATGCTRINIFANGQKVKIGQSADQKISDANFAGQLLVQRVEDVETARSVSAPVAGSSEFETHLVKHFDEMFDWLDTDEVTSQMVSLFSSQMDQPNRDQLFDFLIIFPYRNAITDSVVTGKATSDDLFPPGKFFKSKYAAQAMHSKLKDQIRSVSCFVGHYCILLTDKPSVFFGRDLLSQRSQASGPCDTQRRAAW